MRKGRVRGFAACAFTPFLSYHFRPSGSFDDAPQAGFYGKGVNAGAAFDSPPVFSTFLTFWSVSHLYVLI